MIIHSLESRMVGQMDMLGIIWSGRREFGYNEYEQANIERQSAWTSGYERVRAATSGSARTSPASRSYTLARSRLSLTPLIRTPRSLRALLSTVVVFVVVIVVIRCSTTALKSGWTSEEKRNKTKEKTAKSNANAKNQWLVWRRLQANQESRSQGINYKETILISGWFLPST